MNSFKIQGEEDMSTTLTIGGGGGGGGGAPAAFNPDNYKPSWKKGISMANATARADALYAMKGEIDAGTASPAIQAEFSEREIEELENNVLYPEEAIVATRVRINRVAAGQFYFVKLAQSQRDLKLQRFVESRQIVAVIGTSVHHHGGSILAGIVNVSEDQALTVYQQAAQVYLTGVLETDFLDAAKQGYSANLHLLLVARSLYQNTAIYNEVLQIHEGSFALYDAQHALNREWQRNILASADTTHRAASELCGLLEGCGPKLAEPPAEFQGKFVAIVQSEAAASVKLNTAISQASDAFIGKVDALIGKITACCDKITGQQGKITQILNEMTLLAQQGEALKTTKEDAESKQAKFNTLKQKEVDSRREETTGGGWWFWSWSKTTIVETDFGSKAEFAAYRSLQEEARVLTQKMARKQEELTASLNEIKLTGNAEELGKARDSLSAALGALSILRSSMVSRKTKADIAVKAITDALKSSEARGNTPEDAMEHLSTFKTKVVSAHAMWVQTEKQCRVMRLASGDENTVKGLIVTDITQKETKGLEAIQDRVAALTASNTDPTALGLFKQPSVKQLLDSVEEVD